MIESLESLLALVLIVLTAYGIGRSVWRGLRLETEPGQEVVLHRLALGLVVSSLLLMLAGFCGALDAAAIELATWLGTGWGALGIYRDLRQVVAQLPDSAPAERDFAVMSPPINPLANLVLACGGAAAAASLIVALAPPTAGDALCYHLELPKIFLDRGSLPRLPYHENGTFPLLVEMLYTWALALDGPVAAQLVHWLFGLILAGGTWAVARPVIGRPAAGIASGLVLLTPGVTNQMGVPLNDVALAAWAALALAAWRQARQTPRLPWALAAGLYTGAALGTKYSGLVFLAALAVTEAVLLVAAWWKAYCAPQPDRPDLISLTTSSRARHAAQETLRTAQPRLIVAATAALVAVSVCGGWYVRAALHRGNPVYPFFQTVFAGDAGPVTDGAAKRPLQMLSWELAAAPWQLTMWPERFGGRGHQWGPWLLMTLPLLIVTRRVRGLRSLLVFAMSYAVLWFSLRQNLRFLLPALPPLAVAAAWVIWEFERFPRWPRRIATGAVAAVLCLGLAVPLKHARETFPVASGAQSRAAYLDQHEPTARAARWYSAVAQRDSLLLSEDYRAFYFPGSVLRENVFRRRSDYHVAPADWLQRLRAERVTHLLLCGRNGGVASDDVLSRLADATLAGSTSGAAESPLRVLLDYRTADRDGVERRYRLVELR